MLSDLSTSDGGEVDIAFRDSSYSTSTAHGVSIGEEDGAPNSMSSLSIAHKTFLETVLGMGDGYVLDFTDGSFENLFADVDIDIYDTDKYSGFGGSKANRLRALWKTGSDAEVSAALAALADYVEARQSAGSPFATHVITDEQIAKIRSIARDVRGDSPIPTAGAPVAITTEATVIDNRISIEIHEDIYRHIWPFLRAGDYFHAVEESYKAVREKLREVAGSEKATDVFNENAQSNRHYVALFGKAQSANAAESDFFRGVGYLHLGVQFLRNEKAHTLATFVEPNLAVHYISLASLAYDLITRHVSEETIQEIEELIREKRRGYRSANAFYADFEDGRWLQGMTLPGSLRSTAVRNALKDRWLAEADFTRSWDHSNVVFMQLELVVDELTKGDIDKLLDLPTVDTHGNDQMAGLQHFLEFVDQKDRGKLSMKAKARILT